MPRKGLYRIPCYPQLKALGISDLEVNVLSILLYLAAQQDGTALIRDYDCHQYALYLDRSPVDIKKAAANLTCLGILKPCPEAPLSGRALHFSNYHGQQKEALSEDHQMIPCRFELTLLQKKLASCNLPLSYRILKNAATDRLDFMAQVTELRLPVVQRLVGVIKGDDFNRAALILAKLCCQITADDEKLAQKVFAPGWLLLLQPALTSDTRQNEIAKAVADRWCREGERAIDLSFADGNFFMADGNFILRNNHYLVHVKPTAECIMVSAALLIAIATICPTLYYVSDITTDTVFKALWYLQKLCSIKGRLTYEYFLNLLGDENIAKEKWLEYQKLLQDCHTPAASSLC